MAFFSSLKTKFRTFNHKLEGPQGAITLDREMTCMENEGRNLVVVSCDTRFPEEMVSYALDMANRMDYAIIAVNAADLAWNVTDFYSTGRDVLYQNFKETSARNAESFGNRARAFGLKFAHVIKFSSIDQAVDELTKECGQIEFIISENQEDVKQRGGVENENPIAPKLCVYSIN